MHPAFLEVFMHDRSGQLARRAAGASRSQPAAPQLPADDPIALRLRRVHDDDGLRRLAELEGRRPPAGSCVVAELAGAIVAALPLEGGAPFADPFRHTAHILPLLELRAAQLREAQRGREPRRGFGWLASRD